MGRKNKMKLHKHGNNGPQSALSSPGAGDSSFDRPPLEIEVMRANLLEVIGEPSHQANAKLQLILTDMEKKTAELEVAKKLIKKLQEERAAAGLHGPDTPDPKLQEKIEQNETAIRQMNDINKTLEEDIFSFDKKVTLLTEERQKLEKQLFEAENNVQRLQEEVDSLSNSLTSSNQCFVEAQNASKDIEERLKLASKTMESDLKQATDKISTLQAAIVQRELTCAKVSADLKAEKKNRLAKEEELSKYIKRNKEAEKLLASSLEEMNKMEEARKMITKMRSEAEEMQKEREDLADLLADELKSGAAGGLLEAVKHLKKELQQFDGEAESAPSPNDAVIDELMRNAENDRKRFERLQEEKNELEIKFLDEKTELRDELALARDEIQEIQLILDEQRRIHSEYQKDAIQREKSLTEKYDARIEAINKGVQVIKTDFDVVKVEQIKTNEKNEELQLWLAASKADVKHYRDDATNCRKYIAKLEQQLLSSDATVKNTQMMLNEVQGDYEKVKNKANESCDLMKQLEEVETQKETREKELEAEKFKLNDEIAAVRSIVKKVRKERDTSIKKWKRMFDDASEVNQKLSERMKELEEKLGESPNSSIDEESIRSISEQNDTIRTHCESLQEEIKRYEVVAINEKEKFDQLSKLLIEKESENVDLHRTLVAQKAQLQECGNASHVKTISQLKSRLDQLQKSKDEMQKRNDEDRQKLDSSETALAIQQELNAKVSSVADEMRQRHTKETNSLLEKIQTLEALVKDYEKQLNEMRETRLKFVETMENERSVAENEAKKATDELKVCKIALETTLAKAESAEQELVRVQELERAKLDLLVTLTEEEKEKFRSESESLKVQLEKAQQAGKDNKAEIKKQFDNEARKLKKAVKVADEQKAKLLEELNLKDQEISAQKKKIEEQEEEVIKLSANHKLAEQALEELAHEMETREKVHESKLEEEKERVKQFEKTIMECLEKSEESIKLQKLLEEAERKLEVLRTEFEKASHDLTDKLEKLEFEFTTEQAEKKALESSVYLKDAQISEITKKLEEVSPKKDRVLQLENRLEVIQTAAKAQQKRLEDDLAEIRCTLSNTNEEKVALEQKAAEYQKKAKLADELADINKQLTEELSKQMDTEETVIRLEKEVLQLQQSLNESAEQQTGLVNELILANQRSEENKTLAVKYRACSERVHKLEEELSFTKLALDNSRSVSTIPVQEKDSIDEMFPNMDPAIRQLLRLLHGNPNFAYAVCGMVTYIALIHLYILL